MILPTSLSPSIRNKRMSSNPTSKILSYYSTGIDNISMISKQPITFNYWNAIPPLNWKISSKIPLAPVIIIIIILTLIPRTYYLNTPIIKWSFIIWHPLETKSHILNMNWLIKMDNRSILLKEVLTYRIINFISHMKTWLAWYPLSSVRNSLKIP